MRKYVRMICCILLFLFLSAGNDMTAFSVFAAEETVQTVRVGYFKGDSRFQDGFSDEERKTGYAYEYYQAIAMLAGWNYEYVYGSREEVVEKLTSGEVDIIAGVHQTGKRSEQMLFSKNDIGLEGDPRYFAVNINREDLLEELDRAQSFLLSAHPDFETLLIKKYYDGNAQQQILTEQEKTWLAQKGVLHIGYVRNCLPLSDQAEDGTPTGVVKELLAQMGSYLKVALEPICYDNVLLMEEGLRCGEIDAAFPVYNDSWASERKGLSQTDTLVSDRVMLVYSGSYRNSLTDNIALSEENLEQGYYVSDNYPQAKIAYYNTRVDALNALLKGEANCIIGCSSILQRLILAKAEYQKFSVAYLEGTEEFSVAVRRGNNSLLKILNKSVHQTDEAIITDALIRYSSVDAPYSFTDFIRHYAVAVIAVLGALFTVLLLVFISYHRKANRFNIEQAKTRAALEVALDAADAASQAKTNFLSSMSHDIRTPMNGIIGMTAIAITHIDDSDRVKDCLAKITSSSKHLLALINEILDMSKIESGEISLCEETVNLSALMDDLITLNKPQADAREQDMAVRIINISHENVVGDGTRIQQVFTNLVSNAIKYTPSGGKIEVSLSEKPSGGSHQGCYEFVVKDNGEGMSEEFLPHIFEAFTRADNSSKNKTQGTGLGMAIVHKIVQMMGGTITVESALGKGSQFMVTLPLKVRDVEEMAHADYAELSILVVDDDQIICESTCLSLSELGMESEWVLSGREAVDRIEVRHEEHNDYYAVLLDWKMPDMDGLETAREIRKRVGNDVPIIIISSYDWSDIEEEAMRAGVNGFIGKPLFRSRLVQLFDRLLGEESEEGNSGIKELTEGIDFTGKRALLAEDNELNAEIAMEILGMTGFAVEWAQNGRIAVDMLEHSESGYYDCIFMDVRMPVLDGISATKEIRALSHADAGTIPIFAMTANAYQDDVKAVLDAGMNEHIAKPLDIDVLMKMLKEYLG